jgi:hypothetical protein
MAKPGHRLGTNSVKSLALTTPYTVTTSALYYLGICVVAATVPSLTELDFSVVSPTNLAPTMGGGANIGLTAPRRHGYSSGHLIGRCSRLALVA